MRTFISFVLLVVIAFGIVFTLDEIPFGKSETKVGRHYIDRGREETGAPNIVTSVVVNYRGFDTLGEATILFTAVAGVILILRRMKK